MTNKTILVPAQAAPAPDKPVAWMREGWGPDCGPYVEFYRDDEMGWRDRKDWTPLYTQSPAPGPSEALARINAYIARRKAARGIDIERIHGFDPGHERSAELLLSDLEAVALQAPAVQHGKEQP